MKKAEMGIGTLIVFISMILVASIAAGVLVRTATSLQSRALTSGEQTKTKVGTSIQGILLVGEDNDSDNNIEYFYLTTKLSPGSDPIKLNDTTVEIELQDNTIALNYGAGSCAFDAGSDASGSNGFWSNQSGSNGFFTIEFVANSSRTTPGYLHPAEIIKICMQTPEDLSEEENFLLSLQPKVGNGFIIESQIPNVITQTRSTIFP